MPRAVTAEQVHVAFAHLVISERVLNEIGPAVNTGHSMFIYGPPGNGKTVMAQAVRALLPGTIAIPHALDVGGRSPVLRSDLARADRAARCRGANGHVLTIGAGSSAAGP